VKQIYGVYKGRIFVRPKHFSAEQSVLEVHPERGGFSQSTFHFEEKEVKTHYTKMKLPEIASLYIASPTA